MSTTVQKYSAAQLLGSLRVGLARSFMVWIRRVLQSDLLSSFNVDSLGHLLRRVGRNQAHLPGEARGRPECQNSGCWLGVLELELPHVG